MGGSLYFRCIRCGCYMSAASDESCECFCGALYLDADASRFGSSLGDAQIEVY